MQISPPLIADRQPAEAIEPGEGPFHHPAMATQPLVRVDAASGNPWLDAPLPTGSTTARIIVPFVRMQLGRASPRATPSAVRGVDRRDGVERRLQQLRVMDVSGREDHGEGDASGIDHKMALRARFAPVRRIRAGRFAPPFAATLAESSDARDQSSFSASARRWSRVWWRRSQTPAYCQSRSRRQQVIPLPHPSSCGNSSQLIPLLSTNKMPVNTARSLMRGRPPRGFGRSAGRSGSTTAHSSSLTSGLLMPPVYHRFC